MNKKLRIAQLVLPWIPIPPPKYGGTERVVHELTEGLVRRGHEVTLFSVGESKTKAKLSYVFEHALGLQKDVGQTLKSSFYPLLHVGECFARSEEFDIIHSHAQFLGLPFGAISKTPSVHTFHRIFSFADKDEEALVRHFSYLNFISISEAQRIPDVNFIATVYNGLDIESYVPIQQPTRDYILWAGRFIEKKGPREAIKVAKKLGLKLILAGTITEDDYFNKYIKQEIDGVQIEMRGELSQQEMVKLYQNARLTLVPVKWNEPFGLVPVESMACRTPVVGYSNGGLVETIRDGITGYLVEEDKGVDALAEKVQHIMNMKKEEYDRMAQAARAHVIANFSTEKMVDGYEAVYQMILKHSSLR